MGKKHCVWIAALSLAFVGCDSGDGADAGGPPVGDAGVLDGGLDGTDAGPATSDAGGDGGHTGPDAGPGVPTPTMEVRLDRPLIERDNEQLVELTVTCDPRDEAGFPIPDPGDLVAEVTPVSPDAMPATRTDPFRFTFPTRGRYDVTCRSETLGLTGTAPVVSVYEGIDRDVIRLGEASAGIAALIDRGLHAAREGDEASVRSVGLDLSEASSSLDVGRYAADVQLLVPFDWPTADEARDAGLGGGADDAAWMAALAEVAAASANVRTVTAALPTTGELTPADDAAYTAAADRLSTAIAAVEPLEPSPAATLDSLPMLDGLVSTELPQTLRAGSDYMAVAFATADVPPPSTRSLTLVGALVNIGIKHVVSNYSYNSLLKKVGMVILQNFIQMAIADLIDELIPPDLGAPEIDLACGASCSFLAPGSDWSISGDLWDDPDPSQYRVIFIHPNVPGLLTDVVGLFSDARGVLEGDHWIQIAKNIYDLIKSIRDVAATSYSITDPSRVVLQPTGVAPGSPDLVEMGAMPTDVNCAILPRAGTFIPVRMNVGRGPSYMANITQEGC